MLACIWAARRRQGLPSRVRVVVEESGGDSACQHGPVVAPELAQEGSGDGGAEAKADTIPEERSDLGIVCGFSIGKCTSACIQCGARVAGS
jgi:hypothetical protein